MWGKSKEVVETVVAEHHRPTRYDAAVAAVPVYAKRGRQSVWRFAAVTGNTLRVVEGGAFQ